MWPDVNWGTATPESFHIDRDRLDQARAYALNGGGSGFVIYSGHLIYSWGDPDTTYGLKSTTKSIGVTTLGLAIRDGLLWYGDRADPLHPDFANPPSENQPTGWVPLVTLAHLATQTAGFAKGGGYTAFKYEPGTAWYYSDGGPNWLAEIVTLAFGQDLLTVMQNRILTPIGADLDEFTWRTNQYRPEYIEGIKRREFGSGISASVDVMARIGLLYLRQGWWKGQQLLPSHFVRMAARPHFVDLEPFDPDLDPDAPRRYGLLWWTNATGMMPHVPRDAFFSWGLYESLIVVVPSLDLVIARAGPDGFASEPGPSSDYGVLEPFITPICQAVALPEPRLEAIWPASVVALGWLSRRRTRRERGPGRHGDSLRRGA